MGLESIIEKDGRSYLAERGGEMLKFVSPGATGVPDRACSHPLPGPWLMEYKAPTKKAEDHQLLRAQRMASFGWRVYTNVDSIKKSREIIDDEVNCVHPSKRRHKPVAAP